jgi:DNA-binding transcriptional LysR family regulator
MDIRSVDLNLLPVLDALIRHRSVTRAALELNMSQSATSAALARLRTTLGDLLFVRTGRGLAPTARASELAGPVAGILERLREGVLQPAGFDATVTRRAFRVLLSDVGAYVLWPRIVQAVRRSAPAVTLRLREHAGADIAQDLAEGRIDVAAGVFPGLPGSLVQRRLFDRRFVGLVHASHRLAGRRLTVRAFASLPQVVVRGSAGIQERIDALLARQGHHRTDTVELPSYLMAPPLLESGEFLAVVPGQLAEAFARNGRYAILKLPFELAPSTIRLYWHRRFHADEGNAWMRRTIIAELADR